MMVRRELPLQSYSIRIFAVLKRLLWRHNNELGWHHVSVKFTISSLRQFVLGVGFFYFILNVEMEEFYDAEKGAFT